MEIRVTNFKKGPFGSALAVFDLVFDNTMVVRGQTIKAKNDGTGYYLSSFFGKPRKDKSGQQVMNKKTGKPQWDEPLDLYAEEGADGTYKIVPAGWDAKQSIIDQAVALLNDETVTTQSRGAAKATAKAGATAKSKVVTVDETDDAVADDTDDDLPF